MKAREWRALAQQHRARATELLESRQHNEVEDFLWSYYRTRPVHLTVWHPGWGIELEDGWEYAERRGYRMVGEFASVDPAFVEKHRPLIDRIHHLLTSTASRSPKLGCFGMHEWAMVYRVPEVRHSLPLRFPSDQIAAVVDEVGVRCSHYDAFRFFTPQARPLNLIQPTRELQPALDQPGCIHANMDLLKWSLKLLPMIPSEIVMDAYLNARKLRLLDMQASPYDLRTLGLDPIKVETEQGRKEYQGRQADLAEESALLRARIVDACQRIRIIH